MRYSLVSRELITDCVETMHEGYQDPSDFRQLAEGPRGLPPPDPPDRGLRPRTPIESALGFQMGPRAPTDPHNSSLPKWVPWPRPIPMDHPSKWVPKWDPNGPQTKMGPQRGPKRAPQTSPFFLGICLGPIWGPFFKNPFRGIGRGPGTHFSVTCPTPLGLGYGRRASGCLSL